MPCLYGLPISGDFKWEGWILYKILLVEGGEGRLKM